MSTQVINGKTQADGAQSIDFTLPGNQRLAYNQHQIQVTVRNAALAATVPAAGTLTVKVKSPETDEYESIENGVMDLTVRDNWLQTFDGRCLSIQLTPTGLDADKTYDVAVTSERS